MKATYIHIRRYRAFDQEVAVPLSKLTVLTGPNNLGKSTVLSALDLFFSVFQPRSTFGMSRGQRYQYSNDYPKNYEGRSGRRWPTLIRVGLELSDEDRTLISAASASAIPNGVVVQVEFQWRESVEEFRPVVSIDGLPEEYRDSFINWLRADVRYVYIPAARNVHDLRRGIFSELIAGAVNRVRRSRQRIQAIEKFVEDVRGEIAVVEQELVTELQQYLPAVRRLTFEVAELELDRLVALGEVQLDDGAPTSLQQKGDGFKSLFAISLLQYIARQRYGRNLIFGIEEPEAHLHSSAIYEIKGTLRHLAETFQVIATTHSPILIQRDDIGANVIVESARREGFASTTRPANNLADIRRSLGIRPDENMMTAQVVIVVEGASEETALPSLLGRRSAQLKQAFSTGQARVLSAGGAANIPAVVRALARDATSCLVLTDGDSEGEQASGKVRGSGLLLPLDVFRVPAREGCRETEFEDLFDPAIYLPAISAATGLTLTVDEFRDAQRRTGGRASRCAKWSEVMAAAANERALDWSSIADSVKTTVAVAIAGAAESIRQEDLLWTDLITARLTSYLLEEQGQ